MLSVLIGLVASFGLVRGRFIRKEGLTALFLTPMILPVVVLAVALYAFFLRIGLNGTMTGLRDRPSGHGAAVFDPVDH
jgi:putative spermidine/putrescine transport system permease protein